MGLRTQCNTTADAGPLTVDFALEYASRGWAVLPLAPRSKEPLKGSRGVNDATTNVRTIRRWWEAHPDANIGIRTGQASDLLVIDVDPRNYGVIVLDLLQEEYGPLPDTPMVISGSGGRHYYLTWTDVQSGTHALGRGVDIQADGKYVVAPPSIHPSGQPYEWQLGTLELDPADTPPWVKAIRGQTSHTPTAHVITSSSTSSCDVGRKVVGEGIGAGAFRGLAADKACADALGLGKYAEQLSVERLGSSKFRCVLHKDKSPSASLYLTASEDILYKDWHQGNYTLTLPQVRASQAYGEVTQLKKQKVEHTVWRLRLLFEAGVLDAKPISHAALPVDVKPDVKAVYEGFLLLLGLKEHIWPDAPTTFSWRFARVWCKGGLTEWRVRDAISWLMAQGYMSTVGQHPGQFGKAVNLHRPGEDPLLESTLL
jgi:Bifunctional DNA primase/polymerase, N-terminal